MPRIPRFLLAPLGALRAAPLFSFVFSVALVAAIVPLWRTRLLPLIDLPEHLARSAIWHRLGDPSWNYASFYQPRLAPVPSAGFYLLVHLMACVVPVESALRVVLSLLAAMLPASALVLGRRYGRSPWLALFAFPLVYSAAFAAGNLPFQAALPALLFALAALDAFVARPSPLLLLGFFALALFTFFCHPLPFLLLALTAPFVLASGALPIRPALAGAAALLATVAIAACDLILVAHHTLGSLGRGLLHGEKLIDALREIYHRIFFSWPEKADDLFLITVGVAWLLLASTAAGRSGTDGSNASAEPGPPASIAQLRAWIPEIAFLLAVVGYLVLPDGALGSTGTRSFRLLPAAALLGTLLVRGPISGARLALLAPALAVALAFPLAVEKQFIAFDEHAAGLVRLLDLVPRGSSTLYAQFGADTDPAIDLTASPYASFHFYPQIMAGGPDPDDSDAAFPYERKPSSNWPSSFGTGSYEPMHLEGRFAYLLTRGEPGDGAVFKNGPSQAWLVSSDGAFRLYRVGGGP